MNTTIDVHRYNCLHGNDPRRLPRTPSSMSPDDAATYAEWFACLADPTRVRALYAVATAPQGFVRSATWPSS